MSRTLFWLKSVAKSSLISMGDGSGPAFLFPFKSRTPLLFDYVIPRHLMALWEMIEAYGEYQHFLQSRPGLSERAVSLAAVFFSQYFLLPSIAPHGLELKYLPAILVILPGKYSHRHSLKYPVLTGFNNRFQEFQKDAWIACFKCKNSDFWGDISLMSPTDLSH